MFDQYFQLGHRIRKHYLSPSVVLCLATGRFVPPIHRKNLYSLQYSMLPVRRASIVDLWTRMTEASSRSSRSSANGNGTGKAMNGPGQGRKGGW
jgi:phosphatidylinositol glycan class Q protein